MTDSIGLGLALDVLFWTLAVLGVVGLAALAVIAWFPGREAGPGAAQSRNHAADEGTERYRKAS